MQIIERESHTWCPSFSASRPSWRWWRTSCETPEGQRSARTWKTRTKAPVRDDRDRNTSDQDLTLSIFITVLRIRTPQSATFSLSAVLTTLPVGLWDAPGRGSAPWWCSRSCASRWWICCHAANTRTRSLRCWAAQEDSGKQRQSLMLTELSIYSRVLYRSSRVHLTLKINVFESKWGFLS